MSFLGTIKNAARNVGTVIEDFVNDLGDAVANVAEAGGNGIADLLNAVGGKVGGKSLFSWLGGVIKALCSVIGAGIKGVFGIAGGIVGGLIKVVGGILGVRGSLVLEGLWDVGSPVFGTIIVVLGKLVATLQSAFYLQAFERPLTEHEKSQLQRVFKGSLNYYVIRIIEGHAGLFGLTSRAFTMGNTLYMQTATFPIDLLVHETTHVWQYQQTGDRYASDALTAQWFVSDAYNWEKEISVRSGTAWRDFNNEAQAEFFEDLWKSGSLRNSSGSTLQPGAGALFDADAKQSFGHFEVGGTDHTSVATAAIETLRNEWF